MSFCKVVGVLLLAFNAVLCACADGWDEFQRHCYLYQREKQNWVNARVMCRMHGADLMIVETADEQAELHRMALTFHHGDLDDGFWLGGTDWTVEGKWIWEPTGQPITYIPWGQGQPNNRNNSENCLAAMKYFNYKWSDEYCDWDRLQYVCEKPETGGQPIVG